MKNNKIENLTSLRTTPRASAPSIHSSINPPLRPSTHPSTNPSIHPLRVRREPYERMSRIHELLSAGPPLTTAQIADDLQVSWKTIARDLQYMRDHFGLPIAYNFSRKRFEYTEPVVHFPGAARLTEAEMFALLIANKALAQYQGLPFAHALQAGFQRLIASLDNYTRFTVQGLHQALSFRPFGPDTTDIAAMEIVTRALKHSRELRFTYRKPGKTESEERTVRPYHLACIDHRWHLIAYDLDRADLRNFVLHRLSRPELTGATFTRPPFDPEKYLKSAFAAMTGHTDVEILVEFDHWATDTMAGRLWHSTQQITPLPDGGSRVSFRLSCIDEVARWVLSWGTHAKVLRPFSLADRLAQIARHLTDLYSKPNPPPSNTPPAQLPATN